jgi:hypothetical protein
LPAKTFIASLISQTKPSKWKEPEKKKEVTSRGSFNFSDLSSRKGIRGLNPLGFLPKGRATTSQQGLLHRVSTRQVRVPFALSL